MALQIHLGVGLWSVAVTVTASRPSADAPDLAIVTADTPSAAFDAPYGVASIPVITGFGDEAPYCMGIVELSDGTRILCQIADCEPERLKIGLKVTLEFRKVQEAGESGVIAYAYKAVPER